MKKLIIAVALSAATLVLSSCGIAGVTTASEISSAYSSSAPMELSSQSTEVSSSTSQEPNQEIGYHFDTAQWCINKDLSTLASTQVKQLILTDEEAYKMAFALDNVWWLMNEPAFFERPEDLSNTARVYVAHTNTLPLAYRIRYSRDEGIRLDPRYKDAPLTKFLETIDIGHYFSLYYGCDVADTAKYIFGDDIFITLEDDEQNHFKYWKEVDVLAREGSFINARANTQILQAAWSKTTGLYEVVFVPVPQGEEVELDDLNAQKQYCANLRKEPDGRFVVRSLTTR